MEVSGQPVQLHGIQIEASQPAGLHLTSGIQSSRLESRLIWSASPRWRPNPEIAQHPERNDMNSMRSPNVERATQQEFLRPSRDAPKECVVAKGGTVLKF